MNFYEYVYVTLAEDDYVADAEELKGVELSETIIRKKVIRNGVRKIVLRSSKPGYKIAKIGGKPREVRISSKEKMTRRKAQLRGAKKRASKRSTSSARRIRSMKKRRGGL